MHVITKLASMELPKPIDLPIIQANKPMKRMEMVENMVTRKKSPSLNWFCVKRVKTKQGPRI